MLTVATPYLGALVTPTNVWKGMKTLHTIPKNDYHSEYLTQLVQVLNVIGFIDWSHLTLQVEGRLNFKHWKKDNCKNIIHQSVMTH